MESIIQFTTQSVRDWLSIESTMNEALAKLSVSAAVHQRLVGAMKAFLQETLNFKIDLSISAEFPSSLSTAEVSEICSQIGIKIGQSSSEQIQSFTKSLFFERLNREIETCREFGLL